LSQQKTSFVCPHPSCDTWLRDANHFKNHAYLAHGVAHTESICRET
jgi:hypothetical protein